MGIIHHLPRRKGLKWGFLRLIPSNLEWGPIGFERVPTLENPWKIEPWIGRKNN